jgi:multiple RNA-binding domain-containing protein 1
LFKEYGQIKRIRIPKKVGGEGHRGFGFVEFITVEDARNAFENFMHGHLYGRKLVIEWAKKSDDLESTLQEAQEKTQS